MESVLETITAVGTEHSLVGVVDRCVFQVSVVILSNECGHSCGCGLSCVSCDMCIVWCLFL
jgi:hypothetical protein